MGNFTSIYKALLHDINDPEKRGRAKLLVPAVLGRNVSGWATPVLAASPFDVPLIGDQVWVFFENGDLNRPTWLRPVPAGAEHMANVVVRVVHGSVAGTARPSVNFVEWMGSVAPTNATSVDTWVNTSP